MVKDWEEILQKTKEVGFMDFARECSKNAPKICDCCDHFSGNNSAPAVRPVWCELDRHEIKDESKETCPKCQITFPEDD